MPVQGRGCRCHDLPKMLGAKGAGVTRQNQECSGLGKQVAENLSEEERGWEAAGDRPLEPKPQDTGTCSTV